MINPEKDMEGKIIVSLVEPDIDKEIIKTACTKLNKHNYYSVIADNYYLELVRTLLNQERIGTIISYPLGCMSTETKIKLAELAIEKGCSEIDFCPRYNDIKTGDFKSVKEDIVAVCKAVRNRTDIVLVLQVSSMTLKQIKDTCDIALADGINIFRTNSDIETNQFLDLGSSELEHVKYIRRLYGKEIEIEASGGIKNLEDMKKFIDSGADRVHYGNYVKDIMTC